MIDESIVYRLADYPVLAQIAQKQTAAKRLDARACRYIYASKNVDVSTLSEAENVFFKALFKLEFDYCAGNLPPPHHQSAPNLTPF